jgi:hypothetical protein
VPSVWHRTAVALAEPLPGEGYCALETYFAREARRRPLDPVQHEIVLGSLLGDGTLLRTTAGFCFRIHHGLQQRWYVDHKYEFFKTYVRSPPRNSAKGCYFRTVTHPAFTLYREQFYLLQQKIVPVDMLRRHLTPRGLAIWLMDDGSADGAGVRLNSQSFTEAENIALAGVLESKFGLDARLNRDKSGFRLRIAAASRSRLLAIVGPHFHPNMAYKISQ